MTDLRERFRGLDRLPVPDLRSEIRGRTASRPPPGPPWRRLGAAVAAFVVAAAGLALAGRAFLRDRGEPPSRLGASLASPSERAATVAIAALTEVGLRDGVRLTASEAVPGNEDPALRIFHPYDYGGLRPSGPGWLAAFCASPPEGSDCDEESADAFLTIVPQGDDLVVAEVSGAFTEAQRDRLLRYRESAEPPPARWIYRPVGLIDHPQRDAPMVSALLYWTGAIPSNLGATCRTEVLNEQGEIVYAREFTSLPPESERGRDGNSLLEIPDDVAAAQARVLCGERLPVQFVPEGPRHVLASGTIETGEYTGETWRLVVWRGENVDDPERLELWRLNAKGADLYCWGLDGPGMTSLRYGQRVPQGGCSPLVADGESEAIGALSMGSLAGEGSSLAVGEVSTDVASLELRLAGEGGVIEADLLDPPPQLGIPHRFFVLFLPPDASGEMAAMDANGQVLATEQLGRNE
jgi:hypothetical protein